MSLSLTGALNVNTGAIDGDYIKGNPVLLIFGGASFSSSDYATDDTFLAALSAKTKLARGSSDKLFPLPIIQETADKTVAAKEGTYGYGLQVKLQRSRPSYEFSVLAGSTLEKQLIKFDKQTVQCLVLDDENVFGGVKDSDGNFSGARWLCSVEPRSYGDANALKATKITISMIDSRDNVENFFGVPFSGSTTDLKGLNDVTLSQNGANTSNVIHIKAVAETAVAGRVVNLAEKYGATLASASLWVLKTGAGFTTPLTTTSVALNSAGDGYDITADSTAFTALASGAKILVNLAAPSVLDAADITDVEGVAEVITK
jgi:hypothetical protein